MSSNLIIVMTVTENITLTAQKPSKIKVHGGAKVHGGGRSWPPPWTSSGYTGFVDFPKLGPRPAGIWRLGVHYTPIADITWGGKRIF